MAMPIERVRTMWRKALPRGASGAVAVMLVAAAPALAQDPSRLQGQSAEEVARKSQSCLLCHAGVEEMHRGKVPLGCIDCHGGNPNGQTAKDAHVQPRHPDRWPTSANPERSYTWLLEETPEFVRFVNPGDLRVAEVS